MTTSDKCNIEFQVCKYSETEVSVRHIWCASFGQAGLDEAMTTE